jgi:hypothetical protein
MAYQEVGHPELDIHKITLIKRLIVIFAITIFSSTLFCFWYSIIVLPPGGIHIREVILSSNLSESDTSTEPIPKFSEDSKKIYCYIVAEGVFGFNLGGATMLAKWYYGSEQIASNYFRVDTTSPAVVWLDSPEGGTFRPGKYTVKLFIHTTLVRTLEFEIE